VNLSGQSDRALTHWALETAIVRSAYGIPTATYRRVVLLPMNPCIRFARMTNCLRRCMLLVLAASTI
jgi:hypothetical protein